MASQYQNPKLPEDINNKPENPLYDFLSMLIVVGVVFASAVVVLILAASFIASKVPFEYEKSLVERFDFFKVERSPQQEWLQRLADRLVAESDLPSEMSITVHYVDSEVVNAMATLGGHVFIFRGLLEALDSENALAMVMAHEIAHIKHRHPMLALGRVTTISIAVAALTGISGNSVSGFLFDHMQVLTTLSFSRKHEREADQSGLDAVIGHYGHATDADALFRIIAKKQPTTPMPGIFDTHPAPDSRIRYIKEKVAEYALNPGTVIPLPNFQPHPK